MRERNFHFNFLFCCILICYSSSFVVMFNTNTHRESHSECVPQMNECFFMWRQLNIFLVYKCFCFFLFPLCTHVFCVFFVRGWWENGWTPEKLRYQKESTNTHTNTHREKKTNSFYFIFLSLIYHFFCLFGCVGPCETVRGTPRQKNTKKKQKIVWYSLRMFMTMERWGKQLKMRTIIEMWIEMKLAEKFNVVCFDRPESKKRYLFVLVINWWVFWTNKRREDKWQTNLFGTSTFGVQKRSYLPYLA